jgi:hypothetical protein
MRREYSDSIVKETIGQARLGKSIASEGLAHAPDGQHLPATGLGPAKPLLRLTRFFTSRFEQVAS